MLYTSEEIRRKYRLAKDKKKQISILAELNQCSTGTILEIVHSGRGKQENEDIDIHYSTEWQPSKEQKVLIDKLDELDVIIKPLEDEYKRIAVELIKASQTLSLPCQAESCG